MRLILIILLGLGVCFRLVNLDHKIYWYDETFTSLRSSGYTEAEVVEHFSHSALTHAPDLQRYQQPDRQRGVGETWHSLAIEDPQHAPLYYILASYWIRNLGHSVAAMRLLPALLSLLAFPCTYWLGWELWAADHPKSSSVAAGSAIQNPKWPELGRMAIGLIAVSPFHVLYAQEAREYSLWSVTVLLATAALLRARRVDTAASWLIYALSLTVSLYTFLFSVWMMLAHAVYVVAAGKWRFSIAPYAVATLLAVAAFSPWLWITAQNLHQIQTVTDWTANPRSPFSLAMSWSSLLGRLFYDRGTTSVDRTVQAAFILLIGIAFYHLWRRAPRSMGLLLTALAAVPTLALVLPDLIWGGGRSTAPRYLIPALCGVQLAVAYLLATKTAPFSGSDQQRTANPCWRWLVAAVFTAGILSNLTIAAAPTWWIKPHNQENLAVAHLINQSNRSLVISDAETADLLSLSYSLDADTDLLVRPRCYTCSIAAPQEIDPALLQQVDWQTSNVFLFHPRPTRAWKQSLSRLPNYRLEAMLPEPANSLWRVVIDNPSNSAKTDKTDSN